MTAGANGRAIFLNNLTEAELLAAEGGIRGGDVVIPIGPDARYYAEKKGWKIQLISDFLSERLNQEGRAFSEKIIFEVAGKINEYYKKLDGFPSIPMGDHFLFDLFVIIGQILFTKQLIDIVSATYSIRAFQNRSLAHKLIYGIRPHPDALIASLARGTKGSGCDIVGYEADDASGHLSLKRRLRHVAPASAVDVLYRLKWYREKIRRPSTWFGKKKKVLVLGGMFDWKPVIFSPEFMAGFVPTFKSFDTYPNSVRSSQSVRDIAELISEAVFAGQPAAFDFSGLAHRIQATAEVLREQYGPLGRFVQRHDLVLASVFVTPFQHVIAQHAVQHGKPVICYQHGEMNLAPEVFTGGFTEVANTTHYFAYGKGVVSKYEPYIGPTHLKEVVVVGTTLKKPVYHGGNLVVYATGKWFKTARPYNHYPEPDARLYEAQRDIIAYLEQYAKRNPSDKVVIKANNTDLFNEIPFVTGLTIDYKSRFTDLLRDAKFAILDAPGTTCVEAASTAVPLFVLSGRAPWFAEPTRLLKKRAVVDDHIDRLLAALERFEKNGEYVADASNREFSDSFGGDSDPKTSLQNAIRHLRRIAS